MSNNQSNGRPPQPTPHQQQGPQQTPQTPQGPYAPPVPQYAPPAQSGPYPPQYGGHAPSGAPYAPSAPYVPAGSLAMPGPVRAAQVVIFVMAGLAVLLTALAAGASGAESGGRFFGMFLMTIPLFVLAFRYGTAGDGVRIASIVLASLQIVLALGAAGRGAAGGIVPAAGAVTLLFLLAPASSRAWFRRNSGVVPPQAPYGPYGT